MSMFKKAYARGVAEYLIQSGHMKVASLQVAEKIADHVGDAMLFDPSEEHVSAEKTAAVAAALLKLAEETGSLVTGDKAEQANTPESAAQTSGLAALDQKQRPEGTYQTGPGKTTLDTSAGEVGDQKPNPASDAKGENPSNSLTKGASLKELIRKVASGTGSLITGSGPDNTLSTAAQHSGLAALELGQRPEGYALVGVGNSALPIPAGAVVGSEQPHPNQPGKTDSISNSLTEHSQKAAAYRSLFESTAREFVPFLGHLADDEKVAAVKHLMGLEPVEQRGFVAKLAEEAGLPEIAKAMEEKKDEPEKKEEEKKEEEKKEAAARRRPSNILAGLSSLARR